MRRFVSFAARLAMVSLVVGVLAPSVASAQQSVSLYVGGFAARPVDGRAGTDVLVNNLDFLAFDIKDFNGPAFGGEYLVGLGNNLEAGLGVGFQTRTVPAVYSAFVNSNGTEIEQDLKLRVIPVTATIRFLPLGHHGPVRPYVGAGVGIFSWRYSETGQFLANDDSIFNDTFPGSGSATGPVVLGGVRIPVGGGAVGGEIRYQSAKGNLPTDQGFATFPRGSTPTIDLGGLTYLFTVNFRF